VRARGGAGDGGRGYSRAVLDPEEGVAADGTIRTGVARSRVPPVFEPVLAAAVDAVAMAGDLSTYLYGSVATGHARVGASDVDLLTVGLDRAAAGLVGRELSARFAHLCRGVELAPSAPADLVGESDLAYGNRVFLRHYSVHLAGPDPAADLAAFPADARAARGFNGDIAVHAGRWRAALDAGEDPRRIGRRLARKTLLAAAGLVSVHDGTWTTDRARAARRWGEVDPRLDAGLRTLLAWSDGRAAAGAPAARAALDTTVAGVVAAFAALVGLWE
jgi:hypothetical protein